MSDREQQWEERRKQQAAEAQARAEGAARRREVWDSLLPWQRQVAGNYEERVGIPADVIADQVLFGHRFAGRGDSPAPSSSSSSSSSRSSGHGLSIPQGPTYEQAKTDWEAFRTGFAERVQSITTELRGQGDAAWNSAAGHINSQTRPPGTHPEQPRSYGLGG